MIILQALVLAAALYFSITSVYQMVVNVSKGAQVTALRASGKDVPKQNYNDVTLITIIVCLLWGVFYYLTH